MFLPAFVKPCCVAFRLSILSRYYSSVFIPAAILHSLSPSAFTPPATTSTAFGFQLLPCPVPGHQQL